MVSYRSYDPFGKPRHGNMQDPLLARLSSIAGGTPFTTRGFTDHEHLDDAELIHMNGRVYDYNLGRFLSVDPVIQFVGNSQGINPYSYIMNNPMAGTDPTGYVIDTIWDVGNVIFDVVKVAYGAITGDSDMVSEGLTDLAVDAAATMVPFVPAGASKVARAGADKVADGRQASKKTDTTPTTQKSESSSNTDGGTKTTNGADNTQGANSAGQKTTDIGSQGEKSKADFIVDKQGTAMRNDAAGARQDLEGGGYPGKSTTQTKENGTIHEGVPGKDGPMDVRVMDGQKNGGENRGPRVRTTSSNNPTDGVRSDGSKFRNNESKSQRLKESHIHLDEK